MKLIIEIDEARFKDIQRIAEVQLKSNYFPTAERMIANGIPLDKIRAEIEQLYTVDTVYEDVVAVDKADVLQIIDKYKAEGSGKE